METYAQTSSRRRFRLRINRNMPADATDGGL